MYDEYIRLQRSNIDFDKKLTIGDIKRIDKNITMSIFNSLECVLWTSGISNSKDNKYIYVRMKTKKYVLQRLLYYNYIGDIPDNEYIKYKCNNKGICCNINHIYKVDSSNDDKQCDVQHDNRTSDPDNDVPYRAELVKSNNIIFF